MRIHDVLYQFKNCVSVKKKIMCVLLIGLLVLFLIWPKLPKSSHLIGTWESNNFPIVLELMSNEFVAYNVPENFFLPVNSEDSDPSFQNIKVVTGTWTILQEGVISQRLASKKLYLKPDDNMKGSNVGYPAWGIGKKITFKLHTGQNITLYKTY